MNTMTNNEIASTKTTFDGVRVCFWTDGEITDGAGRGASRARVTIYTALVIASDLAIFTWAELPAIVKAAAKAERAGLDAVGIRDAIRNVGKKKPPRRASASELRNAKPHTLADWRAHLDICRAIHCKVCG